MENEDNLKKIIYNYKDDMTGYERKFYSNVLTKVSYETLANNYKICYFWDFFEMPAEDVKLIHPIIFHLNALRLHILPFEVFNNMTKEQIAILISTPAVFKYVPITIFLKWIDYDYSSLDSEYCKRIEIPYINDKYIIKKMKMIYHIQKNLIQRQYNLKTKSFYRATNVISVDDLHTILSNTALTTTGENKKILGCFEGLNEALIENRDDLYNYSKVVDWLDKKYNYRKITDIEDMMSLKEIANIYFQDFEGDIEKKKFVLNIFENRTSSLHKKLPKLKASQRIFTYFYNDVVEYIEEQLSNI